MAQEIKDTKMVKTKKDLTKFFREVKGELKKVIWPSRSQLINNTITVLMSCFIVGIIIWGVDVAFQMGYNAMFKK